MTSHLKGPSDGEWSVFAGKVVEERDSARQERDEALSVLRKEVARNLELQKELAKIQTEKDLSNKQYESRLSGAVKDLDMMVRDINVLKEAERIANAERKRAELQCAASEANEKRAREVMGKLIELRGTNESEYWWREARSLVSYSPNTYAAMRRWIEKAVKAGDDNVEGDDARKIRPLSEVVEEVMK